MGPLFWNLVPEPSFLGYSAFLLHPASAEGVIVLALSVCLCVCVSVRLSHQPGQTNRHTGLNFGM